MNEYDIYKDMKARTGGEIYIGVVGPVRTGKSTFIKRFMDLCVIPGIEDVHKKERAIDELPQSAAGKTIMTTEPKFIPSVAAEVEVSPDISVKIRLIDCVGYMVEGATGHIENDKERQVKTPWFDYDIPFTEAAEIGTKKVINEHSTVGVIITSDGSFGELGRENYLEAEERTINELKGLSKPFLVILNSSRPYSDDTKQMAEELMMKYDVPVLPLNCDQLKKEDVNKILKELLESFPVSLISFITPGWVDMLPQTHRIRQELIDEARHILHTYKKMRDITPDIRLNDISCVKMIKTDKINMEDGTVTLLFEVGENEFYGVMSEMTGLDIPDEYILLETLKHLSEKRAEYERFESACFEVERKGYGVVNPTIEDINLTEPELIKHGNKFGIKIKATAPSIHMISASIETEIAPIVGTEEQALDLIKFLNSAGTIDKKTMKDALIFGKSIGYLVEEGIEGKINRMTEECRLKLQETLQKIINESNGGAVFIII